MTRRWLAAAALGAACTCLAWRGDAQPQVLDRTVVRFVAPETGGVRSPRFVTARELALEARIEALSDPEQVRRAQPYQERHVRAALQRHIAETLLASLHIEPVPTEAELARQTRAAQSLLEDRVGGAAALRAATAAEGLDERAVLRIVRRHARAGLYLERMVAPLLVPSSAELRVMQPQTPFAGSRFDEVEAPLRRYVVSRRLSAALADYYRTIRPRLAITIIEG